MKIRPRLNHFALYGDEGFNKGETFHRVRGEWFVMGEFSVYDELDRTYNQTKPFYKRRRGNKDGDLGYMFEITICSPGFVKIAAKHIEGDLPAELVTLPKFSEQAAKDKLDSILQSYGDITFIELRDKLAKFADVSELDFSVQMAAQDKHKRSGRVPEHESGLRSLLHDTGQTDYHSIKDLQAAKADKHGYLIMEGDYGGQVYLTAPLKQVTCDEAALQKLLHEVDSLGWNDPAGAKLYYESIAKARGIPGGMGGGWATNKLWLHKELESKRDRIESYLAGKTATIL